MFSFAKEDKGKIYQNLDSIREAFICLMTEDPEFIDSIERGTSGLKAVKQRFQKWTTILENIIGIGQKEPRCFSFKLKEELFKSDPTCAICGQRIQEIDDSAVDHIEQYWLGGKTIPQNARLTHRYCNTSRSKYDIATKSKNLSALLKKSSEKTTSNGDGYSKRKPTGFIFESEKFSVTQWNEMLLTLCSYLYDKYGKDFHVVLDMRGTKENIQYK